MAAKGQTRKCPRLHSVSVLPSGADIAGLYAVVRFVPGRDIPSRTEKPYQVSEPEPIDESKSQIQVAAAASRRAEPSTSIARPGQFDLIPKPLAGLSGSRVSLGRPERSRLLPLG